MTEIPKKKGPKTDVVLRGVAVSHGIVYGKVFVLDNREVAVPKERIAEDKVEEDSSDDIIQETNEEVGGAS